jgi:hypothetical protein
MSTGSTNARSPDGGEAHYLNFDAFLGCSADLVWVPEVWSVVDGVASALMTAALWFSTYQPLALNRRRQFAKVRFAPILLKKSISEGSRLLREGLVRSLGNYVADLVIGSFFNERPF